MLLLSTSLLSVFHLWWFVVFILSSGVGNIGLNSYTFSLRTLIKKSITLLTKQFGKNTGGLITVDTKGNFGIAYNTNQMPIALVDSKTEKIKFAMEYPQLI